MKKIIDLSAAREKFAFEVAYAYRRMNYYYEKDCMNDFHTWGNILEGVERCGNIMGFEVLNFFTHPKYGQMIVIKSEGLRIAYRIIETTGACTDFKLDLFDITM